jgi:hypothetical protein
MVWRSKTPFLRKRNGVLYLRQSRNNAGKEGTNGDNKKCEERRGNFSICHRDHFNYFSLFHLWGLSVGFWINRGSTYPYDHIWVLTLKRFYAEGLQQRRQRKRIGMRKGEPG